MDYFSSVNFILLRDLFYFQATKKRTSTPTSMKKTLLLLTLALPAFVFAQSEDKEKKKNFFENSYAGLLWGPDFYFWKDKAPAGNTGYTYNSRYSQTFGLEFVKGLSDRFLLSVGIQKASKGFERIDKCLVCDEGAYTPENKITMRYTEVPISGIFLISNSRIDMLGTLGFTSSILSRVDQSTKAYDGSIQYSNPKAGFNEFALSVVAGAGFNYTVNYHILWGMNLQYKQPVVSFTNSPATGTFGIGVNTAFYYKF